MKKIVVFASGSGTNFQKIAEYFASHDNVKISSLYSNNIDAYAIVRAKNFNIPVITFNKEQFTKSDYILNLLQSDAPDLIVLSGFLWLVPLSIVRAFPNKIINIHPALLPSYGGKGMYGNHVHETVIANREIESGITIHYVNEHYDEGGILFQAKCKIDLHDTAATLAAKIHELEYQYFPEIIDKTLQLER